MSKVDHLHELDWIPIPKEPYVIKYAFYDTGYNILVSNLACLYNEKISETSVQIKFCKLNPYAQMKPRVILENLKISLKKCLAGESDLDIKLDENRLVITLSFHTAHAVCNYDIEMDLMPADQVMNHIICPIVFGALLSQRKVVELQKRIFSIESNNPSVSTRTALSDNSIQPDLLKWENVHSEFVLESFLKLQNHFKDLHAENYQLCSLKKAKMENVCSSVHSVSPRKCKLQENRNNELSIKFEDDNECILKKKEEGAHIPLTDPPRINTKKKRVLKF